MSKKNLISSLMRTRSSTNTKTLTKKGLSTAHILGDMCINRISMDKYGDKDFYKDLDIVLVRNLPEGYEVIEI